LSDPNVKTNQQHKMNCDKGLDSEEVEKKLLEFGYNEVPEKKVNYWTNVAKRFWGIVPWMLEVTAVVTFFLGKYVQSIAIVALIFFNAAMSLWREKKAKGAMVSLRRKLRIQSRVKRDGKWKTIPARELVPGDLVRIRIGDILPADVTIIDGALGLDQSALTGESCIVDVSLDDLGYSGSSVIRGEATGIVTATGTKTYFGKTISLLDFAAPKLHMEEATVKVAQLLAYVVIALLLIFFTYAAFSGLDYSELIPLAGILLIAAVPVAMPTMLALNMAFGSIVLARQGMLVTRLNAIEDAATMDVLCVDKTGTLTMNKLFVEEVIPFSRFSCSDVLLYGALASKTANQDPIDVAFIAAAKDGNVSLDCYLEMEFVPFDPQTRITEAKIQKGHEVFFVKKGAFSKICDVCKLTDSERNALEQVMESLSEKGLRIIAVAKGIEMNNIELVGLVGVADRIRKDAPKTLEVIHDLGVEVKMLTGDSLLTAKNIASQLGLGTKVATMAMINNDESEKSFHSIIEGTHCIAEIYPEDKFSIVKTLQGAGHFVGMTGDGVNDAPALAQAEVGIAVENASDIAKEAASAVMTVEGLEGIVSMIKTSRNLFQKIYSWTFMMVLRKLHICFFLVLMIFLTNLSMLSITSTLLLLLLADVVTMFMSTDNVRSSLKPDVFDIRSLFGTSVVIGALMTVESTLFAIPAFSYFGLLGNPEKIYTFGFAYYNLVGLFCILSVRERGYFWKSKPSKMLITALLIEFVIVITISMMGFLELAPISYTLTFALVAYTGITTLLINDPIKVHLMHKFKSNCNLKT
jgi:H+-transporting ATPase